jgi:hypothetical protein
MKKLTALIIVTVTALMLLVSCAPKEVVYVSVYDGKNVVCTWEPVALKDQDKDGKMTINDVLVALHAAKCKDGYASVEGQYGLSITKLWGDESGAFGYYLNDSMAMSLADEVKAGDRVYAYVYSDKTAWTDAYSFFSESMISGKLGQTVTVKLFSVGFDETYAPVNKPVAGATVTIDGQATEFKTGEDGSVQITLPSKAAIISAKADGMTLVPPVLSVTK